MEKTIQNLKIGGTIFHKIINKEIIVQQQTNSVVIRILCCKTFVKKLH